MKRKITLTTTTDRNTIMAQLIVNKIYLGMIGFKLRIYGFEATALPTEPQPLPCGQSYKSSVIVIYDSRVVPDLKIPHITTLDS